jgi:hypothetical protein
MQSSAGFSRPSPVPKCKGPGAPSVWFEMDYGTVATRQQAAPKDGLRWLTFVAVGPETETRSS